MPATSNDSLVVLDTAEAASHGHHEPQLLQHDTKMVHLGVVRLTTAVRLRIFIKQAQQVNGLLLVQYEPGPCKSMCVCSQTAYKSLNAATAGYAFDAQLNGYVSSKINSTVSD